MSAGAWDGNGWASETVQSEPGPFTATFEFPWTSPPLHLNQRWRHWSQKARVTADVRALMHAMARRVPDLGRIDVHLVWVVATKHRRDGINSTPTLKALVDGLVDAEIIPDDTPEYLVDHIPEIRYEKGCTPHFELTVTELPVGHHPSTCGTDCLTHGISAVNAAKSEYFRKQGGR